MNAFLTVDEVCALAGKEFGGAEINRLSALLPLVSDALRQEALKVGRNLDIMIAADETGSYASVVKLVTADVLIRILRQSTEGDPVSQISQSAGGLSVSQTYAIPGGGIAASIMKNDLKRLGLRRQMIRGIELYVQQGDILPDDHTV